MDKQRLRERLRQRRLEMTGAEVKTKSSLITRRLTEEVEWPKIKDLHIYRPMASLAEVDTAPLLEFLAGSTMEIRTAAQSHSRLEIGDKRKFDLIIVPTLGFDKNCQRLGWGGGWYDRFLAGQPQALKIGLAYQAGFVAEGLPSEPHDIQLDMVITESIIIKR